MELKLFCPLRRVLCFFLPNLPFFILSLSTSRNRERERSITLLLLLVVCRYSPTLVRVSSLLLPVTFSRYLRNASEDVLFAYLSSPSSSGTLLSSFESLPSFFRLPSLYVRETRAKTFYYSSFLLGPRRYSPVLLRVSSFLLPDTFSLRTRSASEDVLLA